MDRLINSFFSFRPARNWRCRFPEHYGAHYQDEVAADGATAEWRLHGHAIARLSKVDGGLLLELRDAGYPTVTTVSRLNAILRKLCELYPAPEMEFRLKYTSLGGHPDHTFFLVDGKAYNAELLPEETVRIRIDPDGRAVPLLPPSAEYLYFMWHPELEWLRRLHRTVEKLLGESGERLKEVEGFLSGTGGFEEVRAEYAVLRGRWETAGKALRELEARCHLSALGVAAGADLDALRMELRRLRAELREVDDAAARLQAAVRLLS
jgi:hypothetical protein